MAAARVAASRKRGERARTSDRRTRQDPRTLTASPLPPLATGSPTSHGRRKLPPISSSRLDPRNVEAALHERAAIRQEQEDHDLAMAMSRSLASSSSTTPHCPPPPHPTEQPGEAAALAGAAAVARASAVSRSQQLPPLQQMPPPARPGTRLDPCCACCGAYGRMHSGMHSGEASTPSPVHTGSVREHTAAFKAEVESRLDQWSTSLYAANSHLHEIGRTARLEQRERIADRLEAEWRLASRRCARVRGGGSHEPAAELS